MARQDLIRTTASVSGRPLGVFDTFSGGEFTADDQKHTRGGGLEQSIGGRKTIGNVTIGREWDTDLDIEWLQTQRGRRAAMTVTRQARDDDGNAKGNPSTYTGTLIRVAPGAADSGSSNVDSVELEMSCNSR